MWTQRSMRCVQLGLIAIGSCCSIGCQLTESDDGTNWSAMPNEDYRDPTDEENDEWAFAGKEARGDRPRERDPDRWWRKYIMSPKARSIERNMGID